MASALLVPRLDLGAPYGDHDKFQKRALGAGALCTKQPVNSATYARLGRFNKVLGSGLHILIPGVDRIAYAHSLKELPIREEGKGDSRQRN